MTRVQLYGVLRRALWQSTYSFTAHRCLYNCKCRSVPYLKECYVFLIFLSLKFMSRSNLSLTDYMSSQCAAGTHNPWASITQYCSRKKGRGREWRTLRQREWRSYERDNMKMGMHWRTIRKWWKKGSKKELLRTRREDKEWRKIRESVCKTPFELPADSVQLHLITWEGQQRCSFPVATFYAPIYTDQQRLIILFFFPLSNTHSTDMLSLSLPLSICLQTWQTRLRRCRSSS